jgi:hypothetical protein
MAVAATAAAAGSFPAAQLHVLRVSPTDDADAASVVTVTFDRPVAAGLDGSVDPEAIFSINPAVDGRLEWRDPVTLRFTPEPYLTPATHYTVTIANTFEALDGSRLEAPYRFTITVPGPSVLDGVPLRQGHRDHPLQHVALEQTFTLVLSAPVDADELRRRLYVEIDRRCEGGQRLIRVEPGPLREIRDDDPWQIRSAGGWQRGRAQALRRVVVLTPERPLPYDCAAALAMPARFDEEGRRRTERWPFRTYGPLRIATAQCQGLYFRQKYCPTGGLALEFTTPVRGSEIARHVRVVPEVEVPVPDTLTEQARWVLDTRLQPRTTYAVLVHPSLADVFGQTLQGNPAAAFATTGYQPSVSQPAGRLTVERGAYRTIAVRHVNVDTLVVSIAAVPDSLEPLFLARPWGWGDYLAQLGAPEERRIAVPNPQDEPVMTGVRMPTFNAQRPNAPTLLAVQITSPRVLAENPRDRIRRPIALIQVTGLALHGKVGPTEGAVWVTGADDGQPREGAAVTLYDPTGSPKATGRTDALGIARLAGFAPDTSEEFRGFEGYIGAVLGSDRAIAGLSEYDYDLSPWRLNAYAAYGDDRLPVAAALFTERDIYRPGEPVYAKAIVRHGPLGSLRVPAGDSVRWRFADRENGTLLDTVLTLSAFGTSDRQLALPADADLGWYRVTLDTRRDGAWLPVASTTYRVAEYRPPEFLVAVHADTTPKLAGDALATAVEARYLFGAPMGHAAVSWVARQTDVWAWELNVPNTGGFHLGESYRWWEVGAPGRSTNVLATGTDTLGAAGRLTLSLTLAAPPSGQPARTTVQATVTDVNRQTVSASASALVHPAAFYIGARVEGTSYFWKAGEAQRMSVIAVEPDGRRVAGVAVAGVLIRREWHRVRRTRGGATETVGEWVADTTATCRVQTAVDPVACELSPERAGSYTIRFTATDAAGRETATSFYRWVTGPDWVPWYDETEFKMDVIPDRERYTVGDTATVLFAAPFTDAEAWITVERETVIEQRRITVTEGSFTLTFPVTEAYAPNVFVSALLTRGRSAPPGANDDPGRPTMRVGYAELRVSPERKRLAVDVEPFRTEYRPGDTARVRVAVRDHEGTGRRSEVTLWAVDEGVLSLTGFRTPDPIDLVYRPRGLGLRLTSNLVAVAEQVVEEAQSLQRMTIKGSTGGGGGDGLADILRSRFTTTAFFLGSVITDEAGRAEASAPLPDNLTTFRVMAVAVTAGDRYGRGESSLLVTRPLVARPALPRFLRADDDVRAGVVVNHRLGGTPTVQVRAEAEGASLQGDARRTATLEPGRGREVRFRFRALAGDTATFRFHAESGGEADAVETRLPIRPAYHPRAFTAAGAATGSDTVELVLPEILDPERSRLVLSVGTSPLAAIRGAYRTVSLYPYYCSEQLASGALPLIALHRAEQTMPEVDLAPVDAAARIQNVVNTLSRRQNPDGGIGLWAPGDWTTPWLSAYAGTVLLEARDAGATVSDSVLERLANYLSRSLHEQSAALVPVAAWYDDGRIPLGDRVAAADYLSRLGRRDRAAENSLLRNAAGLAWEDRVRLAEVLARGGGDAAALGLLQPIWDSVVVDGRKALLPDEAWHPFYFYSRVRPVARLLTATLAVDPAHRLLVPLVETLVAQERTGAYSPWNTQDYGAAVLALVAFEERMREAPPAAVRVRAAGRTLLEAASGARVRDTSRTLAGLVRPAPDGRQILRLTVEPQGAGSPVFFVATVHEVPSTKPVRPDDEGIGLERWYEDYETGQPVTTVAEGDLVRVRLRLTVPRERHFVVVDDALPAGLEAVDLSLRTVGELPERTEQAGDEEREAEWFYGTWELGVWSPFDHQEIRDDRVVYAATVLWGGTWEVSYVARATTPGAFIRPPAHAEEMYNPGVHGRSDGGVFTVTPAESN